jgi:glutamate N-acetyltransferase/amino-acid N-acetyltransferase
MTYDSLPIPADVACPGEPIEGGVNVARGFSSSGVCGDLRGELCATCDDIAMVCADVPANSAGVFTRNRFCAAPVTVSREHLSASDTAQAIVLNSVFANAATGEPGIENARKTAEFAARLVGCDPEQVLVASTGVIGVQLPMDALIEGVNAAYNDLSDNGEHDLAAARAIMTTDTVPKRCAVRYVDSSGNTYAIGGMCKGSGMIAPNMATMLCVITTDAPVATSALRASLREAVDLSFNHVIVDGDTSTNDSVFLLASGVAGGDDITQNGGQRYEEFCRALLWVCSQLAQQIAADGEGATKLVRVRVDGAASPEDAALACRTVASSPLVKTAIAGHDPNWGRIAAALGRSGAVFEQENVDIDIAGIPVMRAGLPVPFEREEADRRFEEPSCDIVCNLGAGDGSYACWTCDLTHGYITINSDYTS